MKVPKSLQEVWQWKDECYEETKNMSSKEHLIHVHNAVEKFCKKHGLHLRKASKIQTA